jgi:hypothetical protein
VEEAMFHYHLKIKNEMLTVVKIDLAADKAGSFSTAAFIRCQGLPLAFFICFVFKELAASAPDMFCILYKVKLTNWFITQQPC